MLYLLLNELLLQYQYLLVIEYLLLHELLLHLQLDHLYKDLQMLKSLHPH